MRLNVLAGFMALAIVVTPSMVMAKPDIKPVMTAEKEVVAVEGGKKVTKRVPAKETATGDTIVYTLKLANAGDEKATKLQINNPVPAGTVYIAKSAFGADAQITFSVDGGKTFVPAEQLMTEKNVGGKKEKVPADVKSYTHIRWVIGEVLAGKEAAVGFSVKVQ